MPNQNQPRQTASAVPLISKNTVVHVLGLLIICLMVCGCDPSEPFVWSPDGSRAALLSSNGLRFCTAEGKLSDVLLTSASKLAWFPDSRHALLSTALPVSDWSTVESLLSAAEVETCKADAKKIFQELVAANCDLQSCATKLQEDKSIDTDLASSSALYMAHAYGNSLTEKFGDKWRSLEIPPVTVSNLRRASIDRDRVELGPVLFRTLSDVRWLGVAADGQSSAFVVTPDSGRPGRLYLLGTDGQPKLLSQLANYYPAWSKEGATLAYLEQQSDSDSIGSIRFMPPVQSQPARSANYVSFSPNDRLQFLPDGSLAFSAAELSLPTRKYSRERGIYILRRPQPSASNDAQEQTSDQISLLLKMQGQFDDLQADAFSISPNGKRLAIAGRHGQVVAFEIAENRLMRPHALQGRVRKLLNVTLPVWRSSDEVTYVALSKNSKNPPAVMTANLSTLQRNALSTSWPKDFVNSFSPADPLPPSDVK